MLKRLELKLSEIDDVGPLLYQCLDIGELFVQEQLEIIYNKFCESENTFFF